MIPVFYAKKLMKKTVSGVLRENVSNRPDKPNRKEHRNMFANAFRNHNIPYAFILPFFPMSPTTAAGCLKAAAKCSSPLEKKR